MSVPVLLTNTAHLDLVAAPSSERVTAERGDSPMNIMEEPEVKDALFSHITATFITRELVRLKCVSKEWATLISNNFKGAAKAHWDKGVFWDWYFPLRFGRNLQEDYYRGYNYEGDEDRWLCSGVHTSSGGLHALPLLPANTEPICCQLSPDVRYLLTISGGLLLFSDHRPPTSNTQTGDQLLVWNPVTKQSRVLPPHDCHDNIHMQAHMVVDEKAHCYKVILTFRDCVRVYKSTTDRWSSRRFRKPVPWRLGGAASAIMNGKLYFAELETEGTVVRTYPEMQAHTNLRVYEVDDETGTWNPLVRYALGEYLSEAVEGDWFTIGSSALALVECMGSLYALIPSFFDFDKVADEMTLRAENILDARAPFERYGHYGYVPQQFYVIKVNGAEVGRMLMRLPSNSGEERLSRLLAFLTSRQAEGWHLLQQNALMVTKHTSWFECSARGSVIWVAFEEYLVSYDVESGRTKTRTVPASSLSHYQFPSLLTHRYCAHSPPWLLNQPCFAYSPSFNQKP